MIKRRRFILSFSMIVLIMLLAIQPAIPAHAAVVATGGTVSYDGNYTIHTFTTSGTLEVTTGGPVTILVVAGGGGGGSGVPTSYQGGGGGAGGLIYVASEELTTGSKTVTIGNGEIGRAHV